MKTIYLLLGLILLLPINVGSAKILFVSISSYSHIQQMANLADSLIANGHEVWITALPNLQKKLNFKERNIRATPFSKTKEIETLTYNAFGNPESSDVFQYLRTGKRTMKFDIMIEYAHLFLTDDALSNTIKREKFDLMVIDSMPLTVMFTILPYKYGVPFVYFGTYCAYSSWRIPFSPAFVPAILLGYTDRMSFTERLINTLLTAVFTLYDPFTTSNPVAQYAPEKPFIAMSDLQRKALLYLVEENAMSQYAYPLMPNVIKFGSLAKQNEDNSHLPPQYAKLLDRSVNGVVVVSFGSVIPNYDFPVMEKLATAITNTKYDFIVKGTFMRNSSRVMVSDWIPQKALLKHKRVKLFITHGGANGIGEAIKFGKPMLCFPIYGDQPGNAAVVAGKGYGLQMDLFAAATDDIVKNIDELMENSSYTSAIERASKIKQDLENWKKPSEVAVFWIEHAIRFGGAHLRSSSSDMPLYQYLLLDVLAFISLILSIVGFVLFYCLRTCCRKLCALESKKKVA